MRLKLKLMQGSHCQTHPLLYVPKNNAGPVPPASQEWDDKARGTPLQEVLVRTVLAGHGQRGFQTSEGSGQGPGRERKQEAPLGSS